jgi:2-oxoisovalerate dehydrogenase E2 component (dihydrolipoyl transacylase)
MEMDYQSPFLKQTGPALVSPAVRRLLKENNIDVAEVQGTGKDQRVLKEDVQKFLEARIDGQASRHLQQLLHGTESTSTKPPPGDRIVGLSPIQIGMFKSMTQSLSIPHFLYTHTVDLTALMDVHQRFSKNPPTAAELQNEDGTPVKLTLLPFVLKALSKAVTSFPQVNSRVLRGTEGGHPQLEIKGAHNFGLAVDTPNGLLVPVVRNVQDLSIASLAREISRLGHVAREGKLKPEDMQDATLVVSNIGSIGGQVVAPVILSPMTAIVAVGKIGQVPAFAVDVDGIERIVKKTQAVLSWSADHRVLDGATVARCAQQVALWLENIDYMGLSLK